MHTGTMLYTMLVLADLHGAKYLANNKKHFVLLVCNMFRYKRKIFQYYEAMSGAVFSNNSQNTNYLVTCFTIFVIRNMFINHKQCKGASY